MKKLVSLSFAFVMALGIVSCSDDDKPVVTKIPVNKAEFIKTYAKIAAANYNDSYTTAVAMKAKIDAFIKNPSATSLEDAKKSWLRARDFYGQTEAFREADGPIDNKELLNTEGQINAWPLDEGYIDYVSDGKGGTVQNGLIGDDSFQITTSNIIGKNELGGDENISTGWHAIEFLLWGQDLNINPTTKEKDYSSAGNRKYTDYTTASFASRRKKYLEVVTNLLVKDLKDLNDTWAEGGSYRKTFLALAENVALKNILNGIGFIANGEVAVERIDPAIDEGQENEHSCFSDNTNKDLWANVYGINNVIVGQYTRADGSKVKGTSLVALTAIADKTVSANLAKQATNTLGKLQALLALKKPFDAIIAVESLTSNGPAGQLSSALKKEGEAIAVAADKLGVKIVIGGE